MNAYPLSWPVGWKRTDPSDRQGSKFGRASKFAAGAPGTTGNYIPGRPITITEARSRVDVELKRLGVLEGDPVVSTNLVLRLDGMPRGDQRRPADPGVAVYWVRPGEAGDRKVMAIDIYDTVEGNLAAIAATLEAMRSIERHGGAVILERAFTGFAALAAPVAAARPWREVLGFSATATVGPTAVREAYKKSRGAAHPDRSGGSQAAFLAVQAAFEQAARELGFEP